MTNSCDRLTRSCVRLVALGSQEDTAMAADDDIKAQLLGFALVPRPDRLAVPAIEQVPVPLRPEVAKLGSELASLGLTSGSAKPSAGLRARILASAGKTSRKALLVVDMVCD